MSKDKNECGACGLPRRLSRDLEWTEGGNIYTRFKPRRQALFLEHRELGLLVEGALARGGAELAGRLSQARRRYLRHRTYQQVEGFGSGLLRRKSLGRRAVIYALEEAKLFGLGHLTSEEVDPGKHLRLEMSHPYHPRLLADDLAGFWEGLFRVEAKISLEQKGPQSWILELTGGTEIGHGLLEQRNLLEKHPGKRDRRMERCPSCGLPAALSGLSWDPSKGTIYDPGRNRYLVIMEAVGMGLLVKELRSFLGEEYGAAARAAFAASLNDGYSSPAKTPTLEGLLGEWPALGWGEASIASRRPFLDEVDIKNPALPSFSEQKVAALRQLEEGEAMGCESVSFDEVFRVRVGPLLSDYSMNLETLRKRFPQLLQYPQSFLPF